MNGGYVRGRKILGEKEYEDAVKDAELIESLERSTDMTDPAAVRRLYSEMQSGNIEFRTIVGRDFDDKIYELVRRQEAAAGSGPAAEPGKSNNGKKKNKNSKSSKNSGKAEKKNRGSEDYSLDAAANEILRRRNKQRTIISAAAGVIAAASLIYFIIYSRSAYSSQKAYDELAALKGTDPITEEIEQKPLYTLAPADEIPDILDEYKNIYIKNKSIIGWLTIDGTNIDYPVMQTVNNEYYLTHDFEGNEDNNGALFLDCSCNAMFRSDNLIIYGHHMKSGKMFGGLKKYADEDYCKEHDIIKFDTIYEKGTYQVMYVFKADISNAEDVSFKYYQFIDAASGMEFNSDMESMAQMSLYDTGVTAEYGDDILTLSTCDGSTSTTRFVVVAKRIDESAGSNSDKSDEEG